MVLIWRKKENFVSFYIFYMFDQKKIMLIYLRRQQQMQFFWLLDDLEDTLKKQNGKFVFVL